MNLIKLLLFAVTVVLMQRCTGPTQTSGGSTSTDNAKISAKVLYPDSTPVSHALVRLRHQNYLADTGNSLAGPEFFQKDVYSDDSGRVFMDSILYGDYLIEIADSKNNAVAVRVTLTDDTVFDLGIRTAIPLGSFTGSAGGPAVHACIRIRGLERYSTTDSLGRFTVLVPADQTYSVNITTVDSTVDLPQTSPVISLQTVTLYADLGTLQSDSVALQAFFDSLGLSGVPFDSLTVIDSGQQRIRALRLSNRNIGVLPAHTGDLTFLWELDLSNNPLNDLPSTLDALPKLTHLFLNFTPMSSLPEVVYRCKNLKWLVVSSTQIKDFSSELINLSGLQVLEMSNNELTEVPLVMFSLSGLVRLNLSGNQLTHIPEEIGACTALEYLHVDENMLDSLPHAVTTLHNLRVLYAYRNNLRAIPSDIGNLVRLERLELQENGIGVLPESIGSCTSITHLYLWENELSDLPVSIVNLRPHSLTLGNNRLCTLSFEFGVWADTYAENAWRALQVCP